MKAEFVEKMKAGRARLALLPSCDKPGNKVNSYLRMCSWGCGKTTRNITEIGDHCWANRETVRKNSGINDRLPTSEQIAKAVQVTNKLTRETN
jgi:hypothetical protein